MPAGFWAASRVVTITTPKSSALRKVRGRTLLAVAATAAAMGLASCGPSAPPVRVVQPTLQQPLHLQPIEALAPAAGLQWVVIAEPQTIFNNEAVKPTLAKLFPQFRFDALERSSAIVVRKLQRVVIAQYGDSTLFVLQGVPDPMEAERRMRARLMSEVVRTVHRDDAVLLTGKLANGQRRAIVAMLPAVVVIESGEDRHAKAAYFHGLGKLKRSPGVLQAPGVAELARRFGPAPVLGFAPGPFEGEWARGLHGLLGAAEGVGAALRLTPIGTLQGSFVVAGDWGARAEAASQRVMRSWEDLAQSGFGRLTGLNEPVRAPLPTHAPDAASLTVEVDAQRFLEGLHNAVSAQVGEIMK